MFDFKEMFQMLGKLLSSKKGLATVAITASLLSFAALPLPQASAHFGTGIGITFPAGGSSGGSTYSRPESYAAVTHDSIIEELTVTEKSGRLLLEYKVTNNGDTPYTVDHRDGQVYDMAILDKNGTALWRWSDGMAFTQALTSSSVEAHKSAIYSTEIKRADYKKFKDDAVLVTAWLVDTPLKVSTRVPRAVATGSNSGAIFGTIVIGNGPWYDD